MRLDRGLIRKILLEFEPRELEPEQQSVIPGYDAQVIYDHIVQLDKRGYLIAYMSTGDTGKPAFAEIVNLTRKGKDLLDKAHDNAKWQKASRNL
jgi:DNA-binding MarR family transcriptional regulator